MNFERIARMALCFWSEEDDCFVVESPIFGNALGMGDTPEEARTSFTESLARAKEAFENGNLATAGTGVKTTVTLNIEINRRTDRTLYNLMMALDCSQDEVVDYLALFYEHAHLIDGKVSTPK